MRYFKPFILMAFIKNMAREKCEIMTTANTEYPNKQGRPGLFMSPPDTSLLCYKLYSGPFFSGWPC